ncbi:mannitol-1-phosphate 5-dehydrogenase [Alkalihalobacillus alcalophilus ATCC 27647 = CGMCC 1.3604]|uniref:Mannitol-1-phosphate 5-dehydrogenase n=2 Tax=Alkalihalobacillus alcalophilus ATCC 27647 = CGMCC 1.3604 TaxID=1218173 RepID=A0A4S4K035_ALKAL|nr:mannitol-1-phosphate 5-dehydrogenase [Alkalihalobacillus alcalophilus]THG90933.1 mannitol-1-phosphate 5-dehydrogenase [Alkalihalobacillus alcalophilus ATCC 27647 = CGMCC 1.3604]
MMKAVHFGAGNIGRGFIGSLLHRSGYEVVFVDVNAEIIDELNQKKAYTVHIAEENGQNETVTNVRGLNSQTQIEQVIEEIASADIVTTAVGPNILKFVAEPIAKGLKQRAGKDVFVIACENAIGATETLKSHIETYLTEQEMAEMEKVTSFPNSAVDRIVPNQQHEELLTVAVEPFYEWVIDEAAIHTSRPEISGATFVQDLTPYIERKLFTVNTGHAMVAYLGFARGIEAINEAIADETIERMVRGALEETSTLLTEKYGFDRAEHKRYVEKILNRFKNPYLSDDVKRVGRGPLRKLSFNERFIKPARQLVELGYEPKALLEGIEAAFQFDVQSDEESVQLQQMLAQKELKEVIVEVTGLDKNSALVEEIEKRIS